MPQSERKGCVRMEQIILVTGTPSGKLTSISCDTRCPYAAPCQATHGPVESRKGTRGSEGGRGGFTALFRPSPHHVTTLAFHWQGKKEGGWHGRSHLHTPGRY